MGKVCSVAAPITSVNSISINRSKPCNTSNYTNVNSRKIEYIVMHYTGNSKDLAFNNANYFMGANRGASAHYFVDDDSIWQSVDVNDIAWHCGTGGKYYHDKCRNTNSIGIEMCCTAGNYKIGDRAKENAAHLAAALCKYLEITDVDKYVVRHYDITRKSCPAQMKGDNNSEWTAFKNRIKEILGAKEQVAAPAAPVAPTTVELKLGDAVKLVSGAKYTSGKTIPTWVINSTVYVREIRSNGDVVFSLLKVGAVTGVVSQKYISKNGQSVSTSNPTPVVTELKVGDAVKLSAGAKYTNGKSIPNWVINSTVYIREFQADNKVLFSVLKIGAITGVVDKKYLTKV